MTVQEGEALITIIRAMMVAQTANVTYPIPEGDDSPLIDAGEQQRKVNDKMRREGVVATVERSGDSLTADRPLLEMPRE